MALAKHKRQKPLPARLKAIWEHVPDPDAEERILQAYGILLDGIERKAKENGGSKKSSK